MFKDINFYLFRYLDVYPYLLPLGFIGVWRWSVWLMKKTTGFLYKAKKAGYKTSVSVVTPVYNENPETFVRALESWKSNKPNEIIAVIDYTDKVCIKAFRDFARKTAKAKLIITKIPGKREALAQGIKKAKSEIVALIDSDTIWTDSTLKNGLAPFSDKKIGGVATKQSVIKPKTIAQKLFSIRLEQKFWDDIPFLATAEDILICLSGRTAFYRRSAITPILDKMVKEKFMGEKVISGEDKRLTYLIEEAGWKTTYQDRAQVQTTGVRDIPTFLKQQVRWTRNSWRNDLRAIYQGWVFNHPIFTLYLLDRAVQPFTLLISPVYFIVSLILGLWIPVITILIWWHLSRFVKMYPHLKKYPLDIWMLPVFILFNFVTAYIRIYALFSVNVQGWITRWHKTRFPQLRFYQLARNHVLTMGVFGLVAFSVVLNKNNNYLIPQEQQKKLVASTLQRRSDLAVNKTSNVLAATSSNPESLLSQRYEFQPEDSLASVADKFGIQFDDLLYANVHKITNWNRIKPGTIFTIPPKGTNIIPSYRFNYQRIYDDYLQIWYDPMSSEIVVSGRGYQVGLNDIFNAVGKEYLEEVAPKIWQLRTDVLLRSGVSLILNKDEVTWLRLESNKDGFVTIRGSNVDVLIEGVKITSWDEEAQDYDKNYQDGRSYILVKDNARMDVIDSEVAYLGYLRPVDLPYSSYGISWRMSTGKLDSAFLTGEVINSKFHHNYFGSYTFGATGMTWRGNEFYENVRYGLDPHDDSNGFLIENNKFHNNGTHGLILSKRCINNTIRYNVSYDNKLHGIMLHELSNNNVIENNQVYGNHDGVNMDNSSKNIIRNNKIFANKNGILADKKSRENVMEKNEISQNNQYGIYLYGEADENLIRDNSLAFNGVGIYLKTNKNQVVNNQLEQNNVGVYFLGKAGDNSLDSNTITYSGRYGIYAKIFGGFYNFLGENLLNKNNKSDVAAYRLD